MELHKILKEKYDNSYKNETVASIHLFGIEYGKTIRDKNYSVKEIIKEAGLQESYITELNKGIKLSDKVTFDNELTTENLGSILKEKFDNAENGESVSSIHLFGIEYGKLIRRKNLSIDEIITESGINNSYKTELNKGIKLSKFVN